MLPTVAQQPDPTVVNFDEVFLQNSCFENIVSNMETLITRGCVPSIKDLRLIMKWKFGEEKLKEYIEDEGGSGNGNKLLLERIWRDKLNLPPPKIVHSAKKTNRTVDTVSTQYLSCWSGKVQVQRSNVNGKVFDKWDEGFACKKHPKYTRRATGDCLKNRVICASFKIINVFFQLNIMCTL